MDLVDGSEHFQDQLSDQAPSLLTVILDTNPLAWALFEDVLPLSSAVANLLVFINAHLASNYTNRVAVIASHCDKAQWLYPTPADSSSTAGPDSSNANGNGNKYRPFRLIEAELVTNLKTLLASTTEAAVSGPSTGTGTMSTTHVAGALTLALSYINRLSMQYNDSVLGPDQIGPASTNANSTSNTSNNNGTNSDSSQLQSRILLISVSPSADLAHQYIPIMNAIFACQRLSIPIDILQVQLPSTRSNPITSKGDNESEGEENPTVFLQQASDATSGIFIPMTLPPPSSSSAPSASSNLKQTTSQSFLTYLMTAFVTSPSTREYLTPPTAINVDFRAACFCHRRVVDVGYVCSICLSIFCQVPPPSPPLAAAPSSEAGPAAAAAAAAVCLTCGNKLQVDPGYGKKPVVVAVPKKKKKKKQHSQPHPHGSLGASTPTPGTPTPT